MRGAARAGRWGGGSRRPAPAGRCFVTVRTRGTSRRSTRGNDENMGRYGGRGRVVGWLLSGVLTLLVAAALLVCAVVVSFLVATAHGRHAPRHPLKASVAAAASRLTRSAVDGELLGTEIDRDLTEEHE